jgi:hypothetical protein
VIKELRKERTQPSQQTACYNHLLLKEKSGVQVQIKFLQLPQQIVFICQETPSDNAQCYDNQQQWNVFQLFHHL